MNLKNDKRILDSTSKVLQNYSKLYKEAESAGASFDWSADRPGLEDEEGTDLGEKVVTMFDKIQSMIEAHLTKCGLSSDDSPEEEWTDGENTWAPSYMDREDAWNDYLLVIKKFKPIKTSKFKNPEDVKYVKSILNEGEWAYGQLNGREFYIQPFNPGYALTWEDTEEDIIPDSSWAKISKWIEDNNAWKSISYSALSDEDILENERFQQMKANAKENWDTISQMDKVLIGISSSYQYFYINFEGNGIRFNVYKTENPSEFEFSYGSHSYGIRREEKEDIEEFLLLVDKYSEADVEDIRKFMYNETLPKGAEGPKFKLTLPLTEGSEIQLSVSKYYDEIDIKRASTKLVIVTKQQLEDLFSKHKTRISIPNFMEDSEYN